MKLGEILASPWTRRAARWLGYPVFYGGAMLLFMRCTFPYERVGERAAVTFNAAQATGSGRRVEYDSVRGHWLFGLGARNVRLVSPPSPPGDDGKPTQPSVVEWEQARASVSPLRLLFGTLRVAFAVNAGEGAAEGWFANSEAERRLVLELQQFGLREVPVLAESIGVPLFGDVTGDIDLVFPEQRMSLAEGTVELVVDDVVVGDGKAKIRDFVALPEVRAGQLTLSAEVAEGRIKLTRLEAKGPDLELTARGQIRLRDSFARSLADISVEYRFSEEYKGKNEMTKGLFGDPKSKMPGLLDLDPKVKRAKTEDGGYSWRISGMLAKPSLQPVSAGSAAARARRARTSEADGED